MTNANSQPENIFCTNCGEPQPTNQIFCSNCGDRLVNSHGQSINSRPISIQLPKLLITEGGKRIVAIVGLIAGVIAICSFLAGTTSLSGLLRGKLPSHGAFVKKAIFGYTEIPTIDYGDRKYISLSQFPVLGKRPTILLWAPQVDLSFLGFGEEIGGLGVTFSTRTGNYPYISDVRSGSGAELAGLLFRDTLIEIDGVDMNGFETENIRAYSLGPVGSTVEVVVERDGSTYSYTVERRSIDSDSVPFDQASDGQYWELTPSYDLSPGLYCFVAGNIYLTLDDLPAWCFMVK